GHELLLQLDHLRKRRLRLRALTLLGERVAQEAQAPGPAVTVLGHVRVLGCQTLEQLSSPPEFCFRLGPLSPAGQAPAQSPQALTGALAVLRHVRVLGCKTLPELNGPPVGLYCLLMLTQRVQHTSDTMVRFGQQLLPFGVVNGLGRELLVV